VISMKAKKEEATETISSDIDFKWNVQQHISRISKLSGEITEEGGITNYTISIRNLAMMLKSRWDKKYKKDFEKIEKEKVKEKESITHPLSKRTNAEKEMMVLELDFALAHYGLLIELLDRLNLLFETETEDVIDDYG